MVYILAQLSIHDRERYRAYVSKFMVTLQPFGGTLLAADESAIVLEGEWKQDKVVLLSFPAREAFESWFGSKGYQEILQDRLQSTQGSVLMVRGV